MKKIAFISLIIICVTQVNGQVPNKEEWTNQKKTQIKYLIKQVGLLQLYIGYVKKGYDIVKTGWNTVSNIKNGTFSLDQDYLDTYDIVPVILKNDPRISLINTRIKGAKRQLLQIEIILSNTFLTETERVTLKTTAEVLGSKLTNCKNDLNTLLQNYYWKMKPDERLNNLERLHIQAYQIQLDIMKIYDTVLWIMKQRAREHEKINIFKD
ncbi:hypothetical protein [Fulvivirga ligni]|uniref:hypothetical protein n=1 Tax=Fulvivirga ligni TaxID=2904246 RepID=UPI001F29DCBC|nr:hypothetical protein [Fulvivirga ligni]UII20803.1 hypothetical protein LVD16_23465 [Fulvivirga ligni]